MFTNITPPSVSFGLTGSGLSDQGPCTTAGNIASPSESEGDGGPSAYEWVCGECGKDIVNYDTLCPACGADVAEEEDHVDSPPHLFHGYRGWWMGFGSLSFIYGLMISGDVPYAIGFAIAAIAIPALLSAGVWATWKVLRRPLTKGQIMSTFAVAWTVVMGLSLIGRLGQP